MEGYMAETNPIPCREVGKCSRRANPNAGTGGSNALTAATEVFQRQLDQMTHWKDQLSAQTEAMRGEGMKLLEQQKALAVERKRMGEGAGRWMRRSETWNN